MRERNVDASASFYKLAILVKAAANLVKVDVAGVSQTGDGVNCAMPGAQPAEKRLGAARVVRGKSVRNGDFSRRIQQARCGNNPLLQRG